ncbi:MAG: DNA gyrase C-terminal beta-propeller domain-containing protein, partial [Planctomycetota bacterium]
TDTGRVFRIKVYEIPEASRTARGRSIRNLIELRDGEKAVNFMPISDFEKGEYFLVFATAQGKVKRTSLKLYRNVHKGGIIAVDLNDGDRLIGVTWTSGHDHLLLGTSHGMAIRFPESEARAMGRAAAGVKGIDLKGGDQVVGLVKIEMSGPEETATAVNPDQDLLTVTTNGYGKRTDLNEYLVRSESEDGAVSFRPQGRGGKGRIDIRTTDRNGKTVSILAVDEESGLVFVTQQGLLVRTAVAEISRIGRATQGVRLVNLKDGDVLVSAAVTPPGEEDGDEIPGTE